ncbi:hypothetical protein CCAX7_002750 [Capsulimonas corticalis]|uniref:Uncharacterized protein n=1 Tax=Capsulimonas corticalis TaxID=2219043 RepID=A0A402CRT8_9BACT|nr:S53 family peptidase [Capsulimonas corticalis]BDI28224.1 hypothetical protein CCAX7_002750 [Capsulimonas corticalis]
MIASAPWKMCLSAALAALSVAPACAAPHALAGQSNGHIAAAANNALLASYLPPSTPLRLTLALPLRNTAQLDKLLQDLYDPSSPRYHHFLTSSDFAAQFGPTPADYQNLIGYAQSHGMTVTQTFSNRTVLGVSAPSGSVERTFHVNEVVYQRSDGSQFHGPDRPPAVDDDCPVNLLCVGGLDTANPLHHLPMAPVTPLRVSGKAAFRPSPRAATGNQGFSPSDFRQAYDIPSTLTGAGVTMGVFQNTGYLTSDITTYESYYGLPGVPLENVYFDSKTAANQGQSGETTLDIEMQIAVASGAAKEIVYIGDSGLSIANKIATDNRAKVVSCSLGWGDGTDQAEDQVYKQMAAQGQSFFVASGDGGSWSGGQHPQDDPFITSVGGAHLNTNPDNSWLTEPAWGGSGGGTSVEWSIPSYQKSVSMATNGGSTTMRNGPDVSCVADPYSPFSFYNNGAWGGIGGTSGAAPIWAAITALVDQQRAANGLGTIGFINPAVYAIGTGANYTNDFHDTATGSNGAYNAVPGFDLATGWGSPIVANLVTDLAGGTTANFRLTSSPATVSQGGSGTSTVTVNALNGFTSSVNLTVGTLPSGITAPLSASSTTSTSTLTLTASSTATPGTAFVKVTGITGTLIHVTYVPVTIKPTTGAVTAVSLTSAYNVNGIYTNGTTFTTGGFDTDGYAYSSTLLGSSMAWSGVTFSFGPANALDTVSSATVTLPSGSFAKIDLLASAVNGAQTSQTFVVTYTDNSTASFTQSMSDWTGPSSQPGEAIVAGPLAYRNAGDGAQDGARPYVYGYSFPLNTAKTVKSITLPGNRNVVVFAMALVKAPTSATYSLSASPSTLTVLRGASAASTISVVSTTGFNSSVSLTASGLPTGVTASFSPSSTTGTSLLTLTASSAATLGAKTVTVTGTSGGTSHTVTIALTVKAAPAPVSLSSAYNLAGIYTDGTSFATGGLDGGGYAYSSNLIGTSVTWNGTPFTIGAANASNVVTCSGQTITLPSGSFSTLRMLATAENGSQASKTFTVTYTDNSTTTITQGVSDWYAPQSYTGESVAMVQAYRNASNGAQDNNQGNLYGYSFAITSSKTVKSVTLPNDGNIKVIALTLAP